MQFVMYVLCCQRPLPRGCHRVVAIKGPLHRHACLRDDLGSLSRRADSDEPPSPQARQKGSEESGAASKADAKLQMLYIQMEFCPRTLKVSPAFHPSYTHTPPKAI